MKDILKKVKTKSFQTFYRSRRPVVTTILVGRDFKECTLHEKNIHPKPITARLRAKDAAAEATHNSCEGVLFLHTEYK